MPRIVHGTKPTEAFNPNITFPHQQTPNVIDRSLSLRNIPPNSLNISRPIGFVFDNNVQGMSMPPHIAPSRSAPNILKWAILKTDFWIKKYKLGDRYTFCDPVALNCLKKYIKIDLINRQFLS